jgi:hypothetical protein
MLLSTTSLDYEILSSCKENTYGKAVESRESVAGYRTSYVRSQLSKSTSVGLNQGAIEENFRPLDAQAHKTRPLSDFRPPWQQDLAPATDCYRMIEGSIIRLGP